MNYALHLKNHVVDAFADGGITRADHYRESMGER